MGQTGFFKILRSPARFSVKICLRNAGTSRKSENQQKSAKICKNQRKTGNSALFVPFSLSGAPEPKSQKNLKRGLLGVCKEVPEISEREKNTRN